MAFVTDEAPLFDAGTGWAYSDTGYVLLGLAIEDVTGRSWQDAVFARFLEPLGLTGTAPSNRPDLPGLAIGYVSPDNPFGMPERTADADGRLLWNPAVESDRRRASPRHLPILRAGGICCSWARRWRPRISTGCSTASRSLPPGIRYGAGVAIYDDTPRGAVWGHGGWIPGYVSSLRHYADHGVTVAFQINTDVGIVDDSTDLVPALEAALADLAIAHDRQ